ncbi:MAG: hypothetical protein IT270_19130 [Saprospiraceae bacterium]|nr:hypothetical protein [Saprospiraceae bacterium]
MQRLIPFFLLHILTTALSAQVNRYDSSAQVLPFWRVGESQRYLIHTDKYRIVGDDTLQRRNFKLHAEVEVTDSSDAGYIMEWRYQNPDLKNVADSNVVKYLGLYQNRIVKVAIDPYGNFESVENWEELRDQAKKVLDDMKSLNQTDNATLNTMIRELTEYTDSREDLEVAMIREIRLFYTFFGEIYKFNDPVLLRSKMPNVYGDKPFDASTETLLSDINDKEQTAVLRRWLTADHEQFQDAVYDYMKKNQPEDDDPDNDLPYRDEMPPMNREDRISMKIHCGTGWVMFGMIVREVNLGTVVSMEEITLEME